MANCLQVASILLSVTLLITQTKGQLTPEQIDFILQTHNSYRSGVSPTAANMRELRWDPDLANLAQMYSENCNFDHNPNRVSQQSTFTSVGENLAALSNVVTWGNAELQQLLDSWHNERFSYNFNDNTCTDVCGHYTQLVWADTEFVGCGVTLCPTLAGTPFMNALNLVCNYGPAGNVIGQHPYQTGPLCSACPGEYTCSNNLCTLASPVTPVTMVTSATTLATTSGPVETTPMLTDSPVTTNQLTTAVQTTLRTTMSAMATSSSPQIVTTHAQTPTLPLVTAPPPPIVKPPSLKTLKKLYKQYKKCLKKQGIKTKLKFQEFIKFY